MNKTEKMRRIEAERGQPLEAIIRDRIESGASWSKLAEELEVSQLTLRGWANKRLRLRLVTERRLEPIGAGTAER